MMKQVCWHSRRSQAHRGLLEARGGSRGDWWCGSGTLWCKSTAVCQSRASFGNTAESHFQSCETLGLDSKKVSSPVASKNCCRTLIHLRHAKPFLRESWVRGCTVHWTTLNLLEHLETYLMCRWTVRNHFKFVGTDLWTIEPVGTCRNQFGTNWNQFVHGRAWRWILVCFCGLWCFWMLFDPCPRNLMLWLYWVGVL